MRKIEIEPALTVRFGGRGAEFDDGVEVGIVAAQMAAGLGRIVRTMSGQAVPQVQSLGRSMGYRVEITDHLADGRAVIEAEPTSQRPRLRVVSA